MMQSARLLIALWPGSAENLQMSFQTGMLLALSLLCSQAGRLLPVSSHTTLIIDKAVKLLESRCHCTHYAGFDGVCLLNMHDS